MSELSAGPRHKIPEVEVWLFAQLMKDRFEVLHESSKEKPYWYRFIGSPYNPFCSECRSITVIAHNRGTKLSPLLIRQILATFGIGENEFLEALEGKPYLGPSDQIGKTSKPN